MFQFPCILQEFGEVIFVDVPPKVGNEKSGSGGLSGEQASANSLYTSNAAWNGVVYQRPDHLRAASCATQPLPAAMSLLKRTVTGL